MRLVLSSHGWLLKKLAVFCHLCVLLLVQWSLGVGETLHDASPLSLRQADVMDPPTCWLTKTRSWCCYYSLGKRYSLGFRAVWPVMVTSYRCGHRDTQLSRPGLFLKSEII